jgi:hypothetical protein
MEGVWKPIEKRSHGNDSRGRSLWITNTRAMNDWRDVGQAPGEAAHS